jgi:hypothetical protein
LGDEESKPRRREVTEMTRRRVQVKKTRRWPRTEASVLDVQVTQLERRGLAETNGLLERIAELLA